jgi:hypothetical protein
MQFISASSLIEKFRGHGFQETEAGPYFLAYMIYGAVFGVISLGDVDQWEFLAAFASVVITPFGVLYLKQQNGGDYGNWFLAKVVCLGWVTLVRLTLLSIPAAIFCYALIIAILDNRNALGPASTIFAIGFEVLFYWWLGSLIARSRSRTAAESVNGLA